MEEDRELSSGAEKVENIAGRTPEERERLAADARVEAARERERAALAQAQAQEEEKRLKEREKNERLAEAAHRRESREQERIARAEERERAREERAKERRRREGGRGVGGWIAAVVTLGVACLTLASVVAAGTMRMNDLEARLDNAARDALNGWDPSYGSLYYYNPAIATSSWIFSRPTVTVIGNHVFAK